MITQPTIDSAAFKAAWHNWVVNTDGNKIDRDAALHYAIAVYLAALPNRTPDPSLIRELHEAMQSEAGGHYLESDLGERAVQFLAGKRGHPTPDRYGLIEKLETRIKEIDGPAKSADPEWDSGRQTGLEDAIAIVRKHIVEGQGKLANCRPPPPVYPSPDSEGPPQAFGVCPYCGHRNKEKVEFHPCSQASEIPSEKPALVKATEAAASKLTALKAVCTPSQQSDFTPPPTMPCRVMAYRDGEMVADEVVDLPNPLSEQPDDCRAVAGKALLLAARWFKLYQEDKTRYEHPASDADLLGMFDAMQEAREAIRNVPERESRSPEPLEFRMDEDGELDEIVGDCSIHLERMAGNSWWLGVYRPGSNARAAITLHADRAFIKATINEEMPADEHGGRESFVFTEDDKKEAIQIMISSRERLTLDYPYTTESLMDAYLTAFLRKFEIRRRSPDV